MESTVKISVTRVMMRWSRRSSGGVSVTGVGTWTGLWCVVRPLRLATLGPKMASAFRASLRVIGRFWKVLFSIAERKVEREGQPIASWISLASLAWWYWKF